MLRTEQLNVYYDELQALVNVSISLETNDLLAIIGSNGSGKTTLLRTISGLHRPRSGKIFFLEEPVEEKSTDQICFLGIVQVPEGRKLFPKMTVHENLELGAYLYGSGNRLTSRFKEVYEIFPILKERKRQLAGTLSGGEQQMLAIARALMTKPKLLMLDEPTLGLSPKIASKIFSILKDLNKEKMSLLLVSQDVFQALQIANRAYVMENGRITLEGTGVDLLGNPKLKEAYLGI